MRARLLATALAVALVAAAVVVRREVIDDGEASGTGDDRAVELVCITELADACRAYADSDPSLRLTVEDAGTTLDRLGALDESEPAPVWLTVEPYPAMVDSVRQAARATPLAYATTALAVSPLGIAVPADGRLDVLVAACADDPLWRCIGADAGTSWEELGGEARWGTVRPAFGDVEDSALALASFAAAVAGYLGDGDVQRSRWEANTSFIPWLRNLVSSANGAALSAGTALGTMAVRPSALDLAATARFELAGVDAGSARFSSNYPAPEMWLQAVLAVPDGIAAPDAMAADLADPIAAAGWDLDEPEAAGVPGAATMLALRTLWREAA